MSTLKTTRSSDKLAVKAFRADGNELVQGDCGSKANDII